MRTEKNVKLNEGDFILVDRKKDLKQFKISLAIIGVVGTCMGAIVGYKYAGNVVNKGFEKLCETDPTLKEHIANAFAETFKNKMLQTK